MAKQLIIVVSWKTFRFNSTYFHFVAVLDHFWMEDTHYAVWYSMFIVFSIIYPFFLFGKFLLAVSFTFPLSSIYVSACVESDYIECILLLQGVREIWRRHASDWSFISAESRNTGEMPFQPVWLDKNSHIQVKCFIHANRSIPRV